MRLEDEVWRCNILSSEGIEPRDYNRASCYILFFSLKIVVKTSHLEMQILYPLNDNYCAGEANQVTN